MARMRIPNRYKDGLSKLLALDDDSFKDLTAALEGSELTVNIPELQSTIASKLKTTVVTDDILEMLLSLYSARAGSDDPLEEFVDEVLDAIKESTDIALPTNEEETASLKNKLTDLLNVSSLADFLKAADLFSEYEHILHDSRVVTDVRAVFGTSLDNPPIGALIIHNLKLCYSQAGRVKEIFVAMDDKDVEKLSRVLKRAEEKSRSLKKVLDKARVPYIDIK